MMAWFLIGLASVVCGYNLWVARGLQQRRTTLELAYQVKMVRLGELTNRAMLHFEAAVRLNNEALARVRGPLFQKVAQKWFDPTQRLN